MAQRACKPAEVSCSPLFPAAPRPNSGDFLMHALPPSRFALALRLRLEPYPRHWRNEPASQRKSPVRRFFPQRRVQTAGKSSCACSRLALALRLCLEPYPRHGAASLQASGSLLFAAFSHSPACNQAGKSSCACSHLALALWLCLEPYPRHGATSLQASESLLFAAFSHSAAYNQTGISSCTRSRRANLLWPCGCALWVFRAMAQRACKPADVSCSPLPQRRVQSSGSPPCGSGCGCGLDFTSACRISPVPSLRARRKTSHHSFSQLCDPAPWRSRPERGPTS